MSEKEKNNLDAAKIQSFRAVNALTLFSDPLTGASDQREAFMRCIGIIVRHDDVDR